MARKKNPRVQALAMIADIKRIADRVRNVWTTSSTIAEHGESKIINGIKHWGPVTWRKRRPEEYPEAHAELWASLWVEADDMIRHAEALKAHALAEWQKVTGDYDHILARKES